MKKLAATAVAVITLLASAGAASAKAGYRCPSGFGSTATVTQALALPRIVAGINEGAYTEGEFTATFEQLDANDDGLVCFKPVSKLRGQSTKSWGAYYLADDNNQP